MVLMLGLTIKLCDTLLSNTRLAKSAEQNWNVTKIIDGSNPCCKSVGHHCLGFMGECCASPG